MEELTLAADLFSELGHLMRLARSELDGINTGELGNKLHVNAK